MEGREGERDSGRKEKKKREIERERERNKQSFQLATWPLPKNKQMTLQIIVNRPPKLSFLKLLKHNPYFYRISLYSHTYIYIKA